MERNHQSDIEVLAPTGQVYSKASILAWQALYDAKISALKTYIKTIAPAQQEYAEANSLALKAYDKARTKALAQQAYDGATAPTWLSLNKADEIAYQIYIETIALLQQALNKAIGIV